VKYPTAIAVLLLLAMAGCAPTVAPPTPRPPPPSLSESDYRAALARGEAVYRIDPAQSLIVIRAYRGGSLARFGHDHVIASRDAHGFALLARHPAASRADIYVPLDSLSVDEPALRAEAGLDTTPSASAIEGTRQNMLEKVLQVDRFPYVVLRIDGLGGELPQVKLAAKFTLHGVTRRLGIPAKIELDGPNLRVSGELFLRHTDYDLTPFSVLGGALRVENRLDLRFRLIGKPWSLPVSALSSRRLSPAW